MVKYAVDKLGGDAKRVFTVGTSSGAMMTNVLCATYPDVFKAGSVYSGVPAGCFFVQGSSATSDPPGWANQCAQGQLSKSAQAWGDQVRAMYPGWNGTYPRMQIWHGTSDSTLAYPNCTLVPSLLPVSCADVMGTNRCRDYEAVVQCHGSFRSADGIQCSAARVYSNHLWYGRRKDGPTCWI